MKRAFYTLDVFTESALHGNPLAVILDCDGLDATRMQAIAREFNLSETVFVFPPRDPVNSARIRIFTPARELPFAGHPTVGTAVLLAQLRAPEILARQHLAVVIEEEVGPVSCTARKQKGVVKASFILPKLPEIIGEPPSPAVIAAALGLDVGDVVTSPDRPRIASAGVPFTCVPVTGLDAAARAWPNMSLWSESFSTAGVLIYTRETTQPACHIHARMFAPEMGITEDPATGAAIAALAGVLMRDEPRGDGDHMIMIEQGVEMDRPSLITLGLEIEHGRLVSASIGGAAVIVAQGHLDL